VSLYQDEQPVNKAVQYEHPGTCISHGYSLGFTIHCENEHKQDQASKQQQQSIPSLIIITYQEYTIPRTIQTTITLIV
jgi:hypothetical protein